MEIQYYIKLEVIEDYLACLGSIACGGATVNVFIKSGELLLHEMLREEKRRKVSKRRTEKMEEKEEKKRREGEK